MDRSTSVLYNMGLSLLFRGKASLAFSCLQSSLLLLYHQPYLWLRLGECCILNHLKKRRKLARKKKASRATSTGDSGVPVHTSTDDPLHEADGVRERDAIPGNLFLDMLSEGYRKGRSVGGHVILSDYAYQASHESEVSFLIW